MLHDPLAEAIRAKQAQIDQLRADIDVLVRARSMIASRERQPVKAAERSARPDEIRRVVRTPLTELHSQHRINPASAVGHTLTILQQSGKPMHIVAILDQIEAKTGHRPKGPSLVGSLAQHVRDRKVFSRPEPNTYGLLAWGQKETG
jgi:HB1/ASXL restriction endonuclease-like protein with HTH domain